MKMQRTLITLALIAAAGVAHAQMQAPEHAGRAAPWTRCRAAPAIPHNCPPNNLDQPVGGRGGGQGGSSRRRGYTGVKSLTRDPAGNWAAKAMRNNAEVAVVLEPNGTVREQ